MRPVLMTAASAGLGVLPIAIGWGAGAELQQPMAIALIGGLLTSTILTLVALPALYAISEGIHEKVVRIWWERRGQTTDAGSATPVSAGD
jgi:Cu/Ag efflux pump CusA